MEDISRLTVAATGSPPTSDGRDASRIHPELRGDVRKEAIDIYDHIDRKSFERATSPTYRSWGYKRSQAFPAPLLF
jgi:hypothetical protein